MELLQERSERGTAANRIIYLQPLPTHAPEFRREKVSFRRGEGRRGAEVGRGSGEGRQRRELSCFPSIGQRKPLQSSPGAAAAPLPQLSVYSRAHATISLEGLNPPALRIISGEKQLCLGKLAGWLCF